MLEIITALIHLIDGPDTVLVNSEFDFNVGLSNVTDEVSQAELTVNYDANLFEFVTCNAADDNIIVKEVNADEPGKVSIKVEVSEPVVNEDLPLVKITFKAKETAEPQTGNIEVSKALITTTDELQYEAEAINKTIEVIVKARPFAIISSGALDRTAGIKATVEVKQNPNMGDHAGTEVVLFQLMKDTTPISRVAAEKDIISQEKFTAHFNVDDYDNTAYRVKVFVFDLYDTSYTSVPLILATPVELN